MKLVGFDWSIFEYDQSFNILWSKPYVGVYTLLPVCTAADPCQHTYTHLFFMGQSFALDGDVVARGNFSISDNWSMKDAAMYNPAKPWIRAPCFTCVGEQLMNQLAPPLCDSPTSSSSSTSSSTRNALLDKNKLALKDEKKEMESPKSASSDLPAETSPPS
eukprot:40339-Amphidinium_carterae.1